MSTRLLLLGESNVGKTHFGGQLLGRLIAEEGALRMVGAPSSFAAFEEVLSSLNAGNAAEHTAANHYVESSWDVSDTHGRAATLVWPDYGGEQLRAIRASRQMPPEWRRRVVESDSWIVMARIHGTHVEDDIMTRPLAELGRSRRAQGDIVVSEQARLVDFLQWLMFVRQTGTLSPVRSPQIMLLLSCWDELPEAERMHVPATVLARRMPMVSAFIASNWEVGSSHVLGLSALERPLAKDSADEDYVSRGPEAFGFVVLSDGSRSTDLTLALQPLL